MSASEIFREWMRAARERAGVSQQTLADHLGLHQTAIAKTEAGKRPIALDEADAIAAFFGVNLDGVLAGVPPREPIAELVRARGLLAHINEVVSAEIARGQQ